MKNRRWIRLDPFGSSATGEIRPPNVSAAVLTPRLLPLQGRFHLYLYGGYDGNTYNGAMWRFDLVVEQWQLVSQEHTATSAAARPLARDCRCTRPSSTRTAPRRAVAIRTCTCLAARRSRINRHARRTATSGSFATARARGATRPTATACRRSRVPAHARRGGAAIRGRSWAVVVFGGLSAAFTSCLRATRRPLVDRLPRPLRGLAAAAAEPAGKVRTGPLCAAGRAHVRLWRLGRRGRLRRRGEGPRRQRVPGGGVEPCAPQRGSSWSCGASSVGGCADRLLLADGRRPGGALPQSRRPRPRAERAASLRLPIDRHLSVVDLPAGVHRPRAPRAGEIDPLRGRRADHRGQLPGGGEVACHVHGVEPDGAPGAGGIDGLRERLGSCADRLLVADGRRPGGALPGQLGGGGELDPRCISKITSRCAWRATCWASSPPGCRTTSRQAA